MKKRCFTSLVAPVFVALVGLAALATGCGDRENPVKVTDVAVFPQTITLQIGKTYEFTATVMPADAADRGVVWDSSAKDIATVSETGVVTAVAPGTADITARATDGSGKLAKGTVKVIPKPTVTITSSQSLTEVNEFKYSEMVDVEGKPTVGVVVTVAATRGVGSLKITLTTDRAEINGALTQMGLAGQFDLATVTPEQAGALDAFFGGGVPTGDAVVGGENLSLNLSAILALVAEMPGGVGQFDIRIDVSDIPSSSTDDPKITRTETLRMKFMDDLTVVNSK